MKKKSVNANTCKVRKKKQKHASPVWPLWHRSPTSSACHLRSLSLSAGSHTQTCMHTLQKVHLTVKVLNTHTHTHAHMHAGLWKVPDISCLLSQLQVLLVQVAATMTIIKIECDLWTCTAYTAPAAHASIDLAPCKVFQGGSQSLKTKEKLLCQA